MLKCAITIDVDRVAEATANLARLVSLAVMNTIFLLFALAIAPGITLLACVLGVLLLVFGRRWDVRIQKAGEELTKAGQQVNTKQLSANKLKKFSKQKYLITIISTLNHHYK